MEVAPLSSAALDRLPRHALGIPELDSDPAWRLAAAFLVGFRGHTRRAYFNDIKAWYAWCGEVGVAPLDAERHHVDRWIAEQADHPKAHHWQARSTLNDRSAAVLYFGALRVRLRRRRPHRVLPRRACQATQGLRALQHRRPRREGSHRPHGGSRADGLRSAALITLLALNGLRIGEALALDVSHLTYDFGHRVLNVVRKRNKRSTEALAPATARVVEAYIGERTSGPIFLNDKTERLTEPTAWRLVRRLARGAGLPAADRLSPHSPNDTR